MYQEVGKPFADFTQFKVGKWVADFSSGYGVEFTWKSALPMSTLHFSQSALGTPTSEKKYAVRKCEEVGELVADFALKFMHAWGEAGKPVVNFSSFRLQQKSALALPISSEFNYEQ